MLKKHASELLFKSDHRQSTGGAHSPPPASFAGGRPLSPQGQGRTSGQGASATGTGARIAQRRRTQTRGTAAPAESVGPSLLRMASEFGYFYTKNILTARPSLLNPQ